MKVNIDTSDMLYAEAWNGFKGTDWKEEINVRDFIQHNYTPYEGDESFLAEATPATTALWEKVMAGIRIENSTHAPVDFDTNIATTITAHDAGYIEQELEKIVGLQTDKPLKRALHPFGGINMIKSSFDAYGREMDADFEYQFTELRKTHNQGVFDAYSPDMLRCRKSGVLTGLPDGYGRGRIIGDYRRVALYGVDKLIEDKEHQKAITCGTMTEEVIRLREELAEQVKALKALKAMAQRYGFDISKPATNAQEAIQWLYFGYLGAVKDQNGAAMSLGRTSTFIDIYIERDMKKGILTEEQAQEFIDHFIMKLRMVKFARTPEYNALFSGDPQWVTESIGGMGIDGRTMVTKTSFRYLHTLENLGTAPEPNLTVLWSKRLPTPFKRYCAKLSINTSSFQYENDDLMRVTHGDDYAIACCVSSMRVGKDMQFFGARANLAKCLLYAINGGKDERIDAKTGKHNQVGPKYRPVEGDYLDYDDVMDKYEDMMRWLANLYVNTLNCIHYMHDKYSYEALQMALHDRDVKRYFATGIAGMSVVADSLSAIKYAKVKCIRDEFGVVTDFEIEGDFPKYGNNDDRVDSIAVEILDKFMDMIRSNYCYRNGVPTTSILTITSNVVYGKKTGNTPDGRKKGQPLAPGANPMHGRDTHGAAASMASVAKLPWTNAQDGISNTFTIIPAALGKDSQVFAGDIDIASIRESIEK